MRRFSYLIPRMLILLLLISALWLGKDSLLRRAVIHYGQQITDAKVEISHLQTDFKQNRVLLKNVKLADPRNPMTNLLQADMAYLKLNRQLLWNRKFVVTDGQIHGLVINAPRTETGALDRQAAEPNQTNLFPEQVLEHQEHANLTRLEELSLRWLNKIDTSGTPTVNQPVVQRLAKSTEAQWRARLKEFTEHSAQIEPKLVELAQSLGKNQKFANPLRDRSRFEKWVEELTSTQAKAAELRQTLAANLVQLDAEMNEFDKIVQSELVKIQRAQATNQFDEALISELLLSQEGNELVADVVAWLAWFRNSLPERRSLDAVETHKGIDVCLDNSSSTPDLVIEKVELEGSGWFARQHLNFVGTAYNLSSHPEMMAEPTRLDLRALGKGNGTGNVLIKCIVDRRAGKSSEHLSVQFPDLEFPQKQVGHEKCMLITFGDNRRANADINLEINGSDISGTVILRYSQASLLVDSLSDLVGGDDTRLRINQSLSQLNQFKAELAISGTLDDYAVQLNSDLGTQFAKVVDTAVVDRISKENRKLLSSIQAHSAETTSLVRNEIRTELQQMADRLSQVTERIGQLKHDLESLDNAGWSKLR